MKKLVVLLMVVSLVCAANAATVRYQGSGDWFSTIAPDGSGSGWYLNGQAAPHTTVVPAPGDTCRFNYGGNTVTLSAPVPTTVGNFQAGVDESGTLVVNAGGSLTTTADSKVGNNNFSTGTLIINAGGVVNNGAWFGVAVGNGGVKSSVYGATTGIVEINGGTLNITSHLWMATGGANASSGGSPTSMAYMTINDGGVVKVSGNIGLGTINASTASAGLGQATINVNSGGLLDLWQWSATTSIQAGSVLNINGTGVVKIMGNRGADAEAYFALGKIASDKGGIQWVYTPGDLGQDYTTITAIPEPATMVLLGLGAAALVRKKK